MNGDVEITVTRSAALPFVQLATAVFRDPQYSPNAKALYGILGTFAGIDQRVTVPLSRALLAQMMGRSPDTVDRAAAELVKGGVLTIVHQRNGRVLTESRYVLNDVGLGVPNRPDRGSRTRAATPTRTGAATGTGAATPGAESPDCGTNHLGGVRTGAAADQKDQNLSPPAPPYGGGRPPAAAEGPTTTELVPVQASTRTRRATRLPDDWEPSEALLEWVRRECPGLRRSENDKFVDYWRGAPGARGTKLDWDATWRNWMRKAYEAMPSGGTAPGNPRGPVVGPGGVTMPRRIADFLNERQEREVAAQLSLLSSAHPAITDPRKIVS